MGRAKTICKGLTDDHKPCQNWALQGSLYCQLHQQQETEADRADKQNTKMISGLVLLVIAIIMFLLSSSMGCEKEFFKYMSR